MRIVHVRILFLLAAAALARALPAQTLVGATDGLYRLDAASAVTRLLPGVEVRKILRAGDAWFLLTGRGVLYTRDLAAFEERNSGIPVKVIKTYDGGVRAFVREVQEIKDLEVDPWDPATLVACTKDMVYLTRDGGLSWASLPSPAPQPGLKAVAVATRPEAVVFASHPIKGPFVRSLKPGSAWREIGGDLGRSDPGSGPDEVSDIVVEPGPGGPVVWAANSFLPRVYRYDAAANAFRLAYAGEADFGCFDSLAPGPGGLEFVTDGAVMRLASGAATPERVPDLTRMAIDAAASVPSQIMCLWKADAGGRPLALSELWLVAFKSDKPYRAVAAGRHGFYLQTGFMVNAESRAKYDAIMTERNLDMVVVDLKDDHGRLRFEPKDPFVRSLGRWTNPLDVEGFVAEMKAGGRYLVARIVVFKDQRLFETAGGAYAVWNAAEKKPWQGYELETREVPVPSAGAAPPAAGVPSVTTVTERKYIEEYWVDPYCEKVWEYNVAIAAEIIARGFDEVQFDYIRFPTDGANLGDASYRWRDAGMDKESALMSFLGYARARIDAPISIDIYGANGWYRSGVRTGQDVELLAHYADVICPMFYPSHFEQDFMAFEPAVLRPYRIYKLGVLRNAYIARKRVVVRPYVQAFYLNVRYDREWYSPRYVSLQVDGVRDATNEGLTFWNNAGRYDDIPVLVTAGRRLAGAPNTRGYTD